MTAELMGVPVTPPLELSLTLADGSTVVGLDQRAAVERLRLVTSSPILSRANGGGSNDRLDASWWLTPHPHSAVTLNFAWLAQGLAATSLSIGADDLQATTSAAETLWP